MIKTKKEVNMENTIKFLVDEEEVTIKGALPLSGLDGMSQRVIELSGEAIQKSMTSTLNGVLKMVSKADIESETHYIAETKFNVVLNASGEVSIVSLAKGAVTSGVGMEFTIKRKE